LFSTEALTEEIARLLKDDDFRKQLAENACRCVQGFSRDNSVHKFLKILKNATEVV